MPLHAIETGIAAPVYGALISTFLANSESTNDADSYSFSSVSFGAADNSERRIVVFAVCNSSSAGAISNLTIGGVTADIISGASLTGSSLSYQFAIAKVPTGTSGSITFDVAGSGLRAGIGVWRIDGLYQNTPFFANAYGGSAGITTASGLVVPAGGCAIAAVRNSSSSSYTWTGVNEDFDAVLESLRTYSGASLAFSASDGDLEIESTCADTGQSPNMGVVIFAR